VTGSPPGGRSPAGWSWQLLGHGPGCFLAASLAPVCVRCHHAGCVITGASACQPAPSSPLPWSQATAPPALTRGTAASRPSRPPA